MSEHDVVFGRRTGHEQVTFCADESSGLRAIVAIFSTALGPALGGTRFHPYPTEADALRDVLDLSRAMAYKNALAGLDHGGGKAVILGDPAVDKTPELLRAYGRFVQGLGGRYITACDVGTYVEDMDVVAEECDFVTGRSESSGGAGDSSVLTAYGVYQGMLAAARYRWDAGGLAGRRIGIAGVGKVGKHLLDHALDEGAEVVVTDVDPAAIEWVRTHHPTVGVVDDVDTLVRGELDVFSPCALGGVLDDGVADVLRASVVCGGANNQLAHDLVDNRLADRGIVYCPDYLVNAGGVIQVADERHGFSFERAKAKAAGIYDATLAVLRTADAEGITPSEAADRLAERRMAAVAPADRIWTGRYDGRDRAGQTASST
jgi:valine dehydrogenase (NAD+)